MYNFRAIDERLRRHGCGQGAGATRTASALALTAIRINEVDLSGRTGFERL